MKSRIISPVGHHTNDTSPCETLLVIMKYRIFMCLMRLLLEAFTFLSRRIELLLSLNKTFSKTLYHQAFKKYQIQQIAGMKLSAPTSSVSVELRVLIFCFVELTIGNPHPKDNPPPESPRMLVWTANYAFIHQFKLMLPLEVRNSSRVSVHLIYLIMWTILAQLSRSGA